jgi:hypothetical protein
VRAIHFIAILFPFLLTAQKKQKDLADFLITGNFSIPAILSSDMYRASFDGIYEMNFSANKAFGGNLYAGLGYQNVLFQNDESLQYTYFNASIPYNTRLMGNGVFARFSHVRFFNDIGFISYALQAGYLMCQYKNVNADTSAANQPYGAQKFNAPYVQPELAINFIVDKTISFGVVLSYTTLFSKFDPKAPRFNQFEQISSESNNYVMSWLNFGFNFNALLHRKK